MPLIDVQEATRREDLDQEMEARTHKPQVMETTRRPQEAEVASWPHKADATSRPSKDRGGCNDIWKTLKPHDVDAMTGATLRQLQDHTRS